jgi:hypothetical protein
MSHIDTSKGWNETSPEVGKWVIVHDGTTLITGTPADNHYVSSKHTIEILDSLQAAADRVFELGLTFKVPLLLEVVTLGVTDVPEEAVLYAMSNATEEQLEQLEELFPPI